MTFGNAKLIDIFAYNESLDKNYNVQVKALRKKNCFLIKKERIFPDHIYIFVILNDPGEQEDFFIVKGDDILSDLETFFGSSYRDGKESSMPAINYGPLAKYKDNWGLFL